VLEQVLGANSNFDFPWFDYWLCLQEKNKKLLLLIYWHLHLCFWKFYPLPPNSYHEQVEEWLNSQWRKDQPDLYNSILRNLDNLVKLWLLWHCLSLSFCLCTCSWYSCQQFTLKLYLKHIHRAVKCLELVKYHFLKTRLFSLILIDQWLVFRVEQFDWFFRKWCFLEVS